MVGNEPPNINSVVIGMVSINQKHKQRPPQNNPRPFCSLQLFLGSMDSVAEFFADVGGPLVTPSSPKQSLPKVPQNSEIFFLVKNGPNSWGD